LSSRGLLPGGGGAAATAAAFLFVPVPVLTVASPETGAVLWRVPVAAGERVDLNYTNSLYNAPTTERFVVTGGLLRLTEVSSTRQAVLEYLALDPPYEHRNGRLVSKRPGPLFPELTIRIGQTGRQRLAVGGRELPLYQAGTGEALLVRVARAPRLLVLIRRLRSL
jgi:hypothetical protein